MTPTESLLNDQRALIRDLKHEVATLRAELIAVAQESVRREIALAKLEAEVMAIRAVYVTSDGQLAKDDDCS